MTINDVVKSLEVFMGRLNLHDVPFEDRLSKLQEEHWERVEAILYGESTERQIEETAHVAIVAGTMFLTAINEVAGYGVDPYEAILEEARMVMDRPEYKEVK
jgi:hypothetical protein